MKKPAYLWEAMESEIHAGIVEALRAVYRGKILVAHIPNEGKRSRWAGAQQKALGLVAGMPDLIVFLPKGRTACIEVKGPHGRLSPQQNAVIDELLKLGQPVCVVRDIDDALRFVREQVAA